MVTRLQEGLNRSNLAAIIRRCGHPQRCESFLSFFHSDHSEYLPLAFFPNIPLFWIACLDNALYLLVWPRNPRDAHPILDISLSDLQSNRGVHLNSPWHSDQNIKLLWTEPISDEGFTMRIITYSYVCLNARFSFTIPSPKLPRL